MDFQAPAGYLRLPTVDDSGLEERRLVDEEMVLAAANAIKKARRASEPGGITRWSSRYATLFQEGAEALAAAKELPGSSFRVLMALMAVAPYDGAEFPANPVRISEMVGMDSSAHSKATRRLLDVGVIERPRQGWLRFNPEFVWRGSAASREVALAEKIASAVGAGRRSS